MFKVEVFPKTAPKIQNSIKKTIRIFTNTITHDLIKKKEVYKPNHLYAVLSVAAVLFLTGLIALFFLYGNQTIIHLKEQVKMIIELKPEIIKEQKDSLIVEIKNLPAVKESSIIMISKEAALEEMKSEFGEEFLSFITGNPLYDIISFGVEASEMDERKLKKLKIKLLKMNGVRDVFFQENLISSIEQNLKKAKQIGFILGILFLFVALTLIYNTVRLSIFSKRFLIKQMQLIGATKSFIVKPFVNRSFLNGLFAGVIACSFIQMVLLCLWSALPEIKNMVSLAEVGLLYLLLIILGLLISGLSSYFIVNRFLGLKTSDLY